MSRAGPVRAFVALLVASAAIGCRPPESTRPSRIFLIVVDTLRRDHLSCYGSPLPTPNIDRLAQRGQLFTHAVASFHQTSMSMAALFTGRTPSIESGDSARTLHWNGRTWCGLIRFAQSKGLEGIEGEDSCIPGGVPTLGEEMKRAGYRTVGVTSNPYLFRPAGFDRGFDEWVEVGARPANREEIELVDASTRTAAHVTRALLEVLDRLPAENLFIYVHYLDVHDYALLDRTYRESVSAFDTAFGELLDALEERGLLENARVVFTSDHGEQLDEKHAPAGLTLKQLANRVGKHLGNPSFEPVLRVPLIVSPPLAEDASRFLRSEDVFDLIRHLARPVEAEAGELGPDELFLSEQFYQTLRKGGWKATRRREDGTLYLFDLHNDPGETRDVADAFPIVARNHARRIDELADRLAARGDQPARLSPADQERLRALGYAR